LKTIVGELIPGIVALIFGIIFAVRWRNISQGVISFHQKFWGQEVNRFSQLFANTLIFVMGVGFILAGLLLLYRAVTGFFR
jgi:uncharacterized membrane protein